MAMSMGPMMRNGRVIFSCIQPMNPKDAASPRSTTVSGRSMPRSVRKLA